MGTLGQQWRKQVLRDEDNFKVLRDGITQNELDATAWVAEAQETGLPVGIASCVARKSDSLALPIPTKLVATDALRSFITQLGGEGIMADIAVEGDASGTSLLLLSPLD